MLQRPASPAGHSPWRIELTATLRLAWPLALANLLQMLIYAIDVIFIARLGEKELAASSLSVSLFGLILWVFISLTGAVAPLIAAELGARSHAVREVRRSVRMALWLCIACGSLGMLICAFGEEIMLATGQEPEIAALADSYIGLLLWCFIPMLMASVLRNFVSTLGRPIFATFITALGIGVNGIANYAFIFGNLGAPALGLPGAAIATIITSLFTLAAYVVAIHSDRRLRRYRIWGNWWRHEWTRLVEIVRIGVPIGMTTLAEAGIFGGAAFLMGLIGSAELAGHAVALQVAALAFQVPFGVAQAATIRVGYHFGARNTDAVGRAGWSAILVGVAFMAASALAMLLVPKAILSIYVDVDAVRNAALVAFALRYLQVAAAFQLFDGLQAVAAGALRGLQDTRVPMVLALVSFWGPGLGTAVWLGFFTSLDGVGIWIGLATGLVVLALALLWRWDARERLGLTRLHGMEPRIVA